MSSKIKNTIKSIIESSIRNISGSIGRKIRYYYYKNKLGKCGSNVQIDIGVVFTNPRDIYIGDEVWIDNYVILLAGKSSGKRKSKRKFNPAFNSNEGELHIAKGVHISAHCVLQAHGGISIGAYTAIAAGSKIYSLSHHYRNLNNLDDKQEYFFTSMVSNDRQFLISSAVTIGTGCAIGLNSTVLPGTIIPDGTWVAVNSTISGQNIKKNAIYISDQARFLKNKND